MMMECPRCAFVQPDDRFCANCGLNIATYQAKPKPITQQLLGSPSLYIGLAVFFVILFGWYLKQSEVAPTNRPIVEQTAPVTGGGAVSGVATSDPSVSPPPPSAPPVSPPLPSPRPSGGADFRNADGPITVAAAPPIAPTVAESAATEPVAGPRMPTQLDISFYEVSREAWLPLVAEGKSLGDQGNWRVLQFATKDSLTSVLGGARRLPGQRSMATQPSTNASLHFPSGATDAHQGLYFDFSVVKSEAGTLDLEVTGHIALKIDPTTEVQSRVETVAALPATGAVVFIGNLTRKDLPEALAGQLTNSPLSVLNSPDFFEGQSEFILVITGR